MNSTVEALKNDIEKAEKMIQLQKMVLKEIESKQNTSTPFMATKTGRVINSALAFITKPFAELYDYSSVASVNPEKLIRQKDINKAQSIIELAAKIENRESKGAREAAFKAAQMKMHLDKYNPQLGDDIYPITQALKNVVNRLRPTPPNPDIQDKVKETLGVLNESQST